MQTANIIKQIDPEKIIDIERFKLEEAACTNSCLAMLVIETLKNSGLKKANICDIGGGSGVLVREIARQSPCKIKATVLDVMNYGADFSGEVNFINSSILENKVNDNEFDIVIFRHLLHHLVDFNIQNTLVLQENALREMLRIVKPGGYLIFEEEVNCVKIFSRIVYHLSKLANTFGFKVPYFQAGISIVSFMTQKEIVESLKRISGDRQIQILKEFYTPWNMSIRWKLTILMAKVGSLFMVVRKNQVL